MAKNWFIFDKMKIKKIYIGKIFTGKQGHARNTISFLNRCLERSPSSGLAKSGIILPKLSAYVVTLVIDTSPGCSPKRGLNASARYVDPGQAAQST